MATRTTKSIRMEPDTQRLLKLLAAYEDKTEGEIVEEALPLYLQMRTLSYGNELPAARELANSSPETAGEIVGRMIEAIESALEEGQRAPQPGAAKKKLLSRRKRKVAS